MERQYFVYILTNHHNAVFYTGVASNLSRRIAEHRRGTVPGFSSRYNLDKLAFYERVSDAAAAITRENQIKAVPRIRIRLEHAELDPRRMAQHFPACRHAPHQRDDEPARCRGRPRVLSLSVSRRAPPPPETDDEPPEAEA